MIEVSAALAFVISLLAASSQTSPECTTAQQCRQLSRDAIASAQFERAHDLAWLAYQRGRQDPETLILLARTQSLSGRGDDAFVMLRRLAEAGVVVEDVSTSDDFARVRAHAEWPTLRETFERLASGGAGTAARAASAAKERETTPPPPAPVAKPRAVLPPPSEVETPLAVPDPSEPATPAAPTAKSDEPPAALKLAGEDLSVPAMAFTPAALAYDAVSARFILSAGGSDALTVLSQTSSNATALTSRGWSGLDRTTALAIDRVAGDLWVAVQGGTKSALHRLQLISGRRLSEIAPSETSAVDIVSLYIGRDGLYALDRAGRRVLRRVPRGNSLEQYVALSADLAPLGLAQSSAALYVSHADGLVRIDAASRRSAAVSASAEADLSSLHSLAWHDGMLIAIQRRGNDRQVVRLRLNAAGTRVTRIDIVAPAASEVATLAGGVYYYFADDHTGARVVRAIPAR
jgi:hypothetical protein